jgi:hypothetical protein
MLTAYGQDKCDAIPVTGRGCLLGYETSRIPHFLDSRLRDGGEVSLTRWRLLYTHQGYSCYSFQLEASKLQGHIQPVTRSGLMARIETSL